MYAEQTYVPRFREKANLLAHQIPILLTAQTEASHSHFWLFLFFFVWEGNVFTTHHVPLESHLTVWVVSLLAFFHLRLLSCNFN